MLVAALLAVTAQIAEPTIVAELPQPVSGQIASAITDCKSALRDGGMESLATGGWKPAKLKKSSLLDSDIKGLMTKGSDSPLVEFKRARNGLTTCTLWGRVDKRQDLRPLVSTIANALPSKSAEKIMAAYLFAGEDVVAAMNLHESYNGPVFNIGIFPVKRGKK